MAGKLPAVSVLPALVVTGADSSVVVDDPPPLDDVDRYRLKCRILKAKVRELEKEITRHKVEELKRKACMALEEKETKDDSCALRRRGGELKELGGRLIDTLSAIQRKEEKENVEMRALLVGVREREDKILHLLLDNAKKAKPTAGTPPTTTGKKVTVIMSAKEARRQLESALALLKENKAEEVRFLDEALLRERAKVEALQHLSQSLEQGIREEKVKMVELKYLLQNERLPARALRLMGLTHHPPTAETRSVLVSCGLDVDGASVPISATSPTTTGPALVLAASSEDKLMAVGDGGASDAAPPEEAPDAGEAVASECTVKKRKDSSRGRGHQVLDKYGIDCSNPRRSVPVRTSASRLVDKNTL